MERFFAEYPIASWTLILWAIFAVILVIYAIYLSAESDIISLGQNVIWASFVVAMSVAAVIFRINCPFFEAFKEYGTGVGERFCLMAFFLTLPASGAFAIGTSVFIGAGGAMEGSFIARAAAYLVAVIVVAFIPFIGLGLNNEVLYNILSFGIFGLGIVATVIVEATMNKEGWTN